MWKLRKNKTPIKAATDIDKNADSLKEQLRKLAEYGERMKELQEQDLTPPVINEMLVTFHLSQDTYRCISRLSGEISEDIEIMIKDLEKTWYK